MNLNYQPHHGIMNLNYLMDHILYEIFKSSLSQKTITDNSPVQICLNSIRNRISFKIKTLKLTMKLFGSIEKKKTKGRNS